MFYKKAENNIFQSTQFVWQSDTDFKTIHHTSQRSLTFPSKC